MRARAVVPALLAGALLAACAAPGLHGGGHGQPLEVMYAFSGAQAAGFRDAVDAWAREQGATVTYTHSDDIARDLARRKREGHLPDVAVLPQPGLVQELRAQGDLEAIDEWLPVDTVDSGLVPGLVPPLQSGGHTYAVPVSMSVKSLLWYDRHALHALGLEPPQTLDQLVAADRRITSTGRTAWCLGLADGPTSGWAGTDWVEELLLKQSGPQVYDQWVGGRIPFSDPRVERALRTYADLVLGPRGVEGGGAAAAARDVRHAADGLFADPRRCVLLKQGSYVTQEGFLPDQVRAHVDMSTSVVAFPSGSSDAIEVGADSVALLRGHDGAARGLVRYMATDMRFGADWAGSQDRGFISPRKRFALSRYPSTTTRKIAAAAYQTSDVRFDGSDQMPPAVSTAFWSAMVDLTAGRADVDQVVARLDAVRASRS